MGISSGQGYTPSNDFDNFQIRMLHQVPTPSLFLVNIIGKYQLSCKYMGVSVLDHSLLGVLSYVRKLVFNPASINMLTEYVLE